MAPNEITTEQLLALFTEKANAPPDGPNELLVRHLKCKKSVQLASILAEAMDRYAANESQQLAAYILFAGFPAGDHSPRRRKNSHAHSAKNPRDTVRTDIFS